RKQLLDAVAKLHVIGVGVLWGGMIDQDSKNNETYILHLYQDGLGMPDRDYYLKDDAESKRVRDAYLPYMEGIHTLAGFSAKEAKRRSAVIMDIETRLAKASMNKVDARDADKTYHKKSARDLSKLAPAIDWKRYFARIGRRDILSVIAMQPDFLHGVSRMLEAVAIDDWKTYLEWHLVNDFSGALSPAFVAKNFSFYGTVLTGTKV